MKPKLSGRWCVAMIASILSLASTVVGQPAAGPLTIQGLDQFSIVGVRSRGMGGTGNASATDATALFSNPAALSRLSAFEFRAGGLTGQTNRAQTQDWVPFRSLPGLSVLFESLTGTVTPPSDTTLGPWESLQTQYDDIVPDWKTKTWETQSLSLVAAMPFSVENVEISAGVGFSQVINLDQYYQNNNSMSPYLGQQRPDPFLITQRTDTLHINWYQYTRTREGSVYGITPGISIGLLQGLSLGGSATFLTGSSDDGEYRLERGHINIAIENAEPDNFMLDTVYYTQAKAGTSTYRGNIFNLGLLFQQERYSLGVAVKLPMRLTRSWDREVTIVDTTRKSFPVRIDSMTARSYHESGEDYLEYPMSYSLGFVLTPTQQWMIAFDYELRRLADATYSSTSDGAASYPWVSNKGVIRIGVEFRASDLLALRGGYRDDIQAFSPDGSAIPGEPARGQIYSLGAGFTISNILVDFAYEYAHLQYQDIYQSNVNYNTQKRYQFMLEVAYRIQR